MFKVKIDAERCKGCNLCLGVCPKNLIKAGFTFNKKGFCPVRVEKEEECLGCLYCALVCPDAAIEILKDD